MTGDWGAYARAARQLGEIRERDRQRSGGQARTLASTRAEIGELSDTLLEQQATLTELAGSLRLPPPALVAQPPGAAPLGTDLSVTDRLERARRAVAAATAAATAADAAADVPPLLPNSSPRTRNVAVYAAFAVVGLLAQLVMIGLFSRHLTDAVTTSAWACCGFPVLAYIGGYLAIGVACKPRRSKEPVPRSPRLGALICAASLPVYALVFGVVGQFI